MTRKILAIDDSLTLREFIQRCLSRHSADYQIILAKDGGEGLTLAQAERPDLILLDFILPDMKGDEVCRRLRANPETARYPVVLMSSSAADIKRTQAQFENVVKAIAKPFTPELLCATVGYALRESNRVPRTAAAAPLSTSGSTPPATPVAAPKTLTGHTGHFPIADVLSAIEQDQLTGVFRLFITSKPVELYLASGRPMVVTSRDAPAYLHANRYRLTTDQERVLEPCFKLQSETGQPIYVSLAERKVMSPAEAAAACQETGLRLFASAWTAPRAHYEFQPLTELPSWTADLPPYEGVIVDWAMESLRQVGDEFRSAMAWGEPTGIPAYTRRGYERIQQIPLSDEELAFAGLIGPAQSLLSITEAMRIDVEAGQRILYRFLCLGVFDYWPASLLKAA